MKMLSYHPPARTAGAHCLEPELGTQNCHLPTLTPARALGTNFPDSLDPQERGTPGGDGNQEGRSSELCWRRTGGRGAGQKKNLPFSRPTDPPVMSAAYLDRGPQETDFEAEICAQKVY